MHYVLARITVKPEVAELAKCILVDLASRSRRAAGCMGCELFQQTGAPHVFQTVEQWKDKADAEAHMQSLDVGAAIAAAGPLLAGALEFLSYDRLL